MEIMLRPETADRIRHALGDDIDLAPSAVPSALARLSVEAPVLYSEVLAEISGTEIRLDSERALARKRRSAVWRRALFSWGEYQSDAGDHLMAKRHVAAAVPLGLAGLLLLGLGWSALFSHRPSAVARHAAVPAHPPVTMATRPRPITPIVAPPVSLPAVPPLPIAEGSARWDLAAGIPVLPRTVTSVSTAPGSPLVLAFAATQQERPAIPSSLAGGTGARSSILVSPIVYEQQPAALPGATDTSEHAAAGAAPQGDGVQWSAGERVSGRLVTGIAVASSGSPTPVIAETSDPKATWLGQASLGPDGRVQVAFTLAGPTEAVRGVALDPVHLVPGLMASTSLRQPEAAAAALTAATQAAASYARALAQEGQLTLSDGWANLAVGQPGPAWTYFASSLADGIAPRSGIPGPIETGEIATGAPLLILVTEVH